MNEDKPRTRADCSQVPRPCPFVSCRYHLYLDVFPSHRIGLNFPGTEVHKLKHSCALDEAEADGLFLNEVACRMGLSGERVRQLEEMALDKLYLACMAEQRTLRRSGRPKNITA